MNEEPRANHFLLGKFAESEIQRLHGWKANRLYEKLEEQRKSAPQFVLHDCPSLAGGDASIELVYNKVLKDFIVKYQSLRGRRVLYSHGWDCHALPIEYRVREEIGKNSDKNLEIPEIKAVRKACKEHSCEQVDIQRDLLKRFGISGNLDACYLTKNPDYQAEVLRLFADLVEKGFIVREKRPVCWSIACRTAVDEADLGYKELISQGVYVKFPVIGYPGTSVIIWTPAPWALPATLAIAYHPELNYTLVHAMDGSYIVSVSMLGEISEKFKWEGYQIIRSLYGENLAELKCQHPFIDREVPLIADESLVDGGSGCGFSPIIPAHGMADFHFAKKHGLEVFSPIDDNGCFCNTADLPAHQQIPASLVGKSLLFKEGKCEANDAVISLLRDNSMLLCQEEIQQILPCCRQSHVPIIIKPMEQWFMEMDRTEFQVQVCQAIHRSEWIGDWKKENVEADIGARPDWCISRQQSWGVPIPAFFDAQGAPILDARIIRSAANLIEKQGSNVWFEKDAADLWNLLKPAEWQGSDAITKCDEILDPWFGSGASFRFLVKSRKELCCQRTGGSSTVSPLHADLFFDGCDPHSGRFQYPLLLSIADNGFAPYACAVAHGNIIDTHNEKNPSEPKDQSGDSISKSVSDRINIYGADVLRLWAASQDFRNDIFIREDALQQVMEFSESIRNVLNFQLSHLHDCDFVQNAESEMQLDILDRWILLEYSKLEKKFEDAFQALEFHLFYIQLTQFINDLSANYHRLIKQELVVENSPRRRAIQTTLFWITKGLCQILSPILVFTADEAWESIPGNRAGESVHLTTWQPLKFHYVLSEGEQASVRCQLQRFPQS